MIPTRKYICRCDHDRLAVVAVDKVKFRINYCSMFKDSFIKKTLKPYVFL